MNDDIDKRAVYGENAKNHRLLSKCSKAKPYKMSQKPRNQE